MNRHLLTIHFGWILAALFCHGIAASAPPTAVFRAGAYAIDITPEQFPVSSAGSMVHRQATHAHDPLHARCLVLDDGKSQIAFAICDSCMIPREIFDAAKQRATELTGIPSGHILASATHTHTAVTVGDVFQSKSETDYCDFLAERIAEGIAKAADQLEPARIGWAVGNNPRQVFNRRWYMRRGVAISDPFDRGTDRVRMNPPRASEDLVKPAGLVDAEVPLISVQGTDGHPIAVLANYSLHYVGGVPAHALSADYFGEFARHLSRLIQEDTDAPKAKYPFVAIMSNGTSGDINNINFFEGMPTQRPFEQIRCVAADVADSAHAALKHVKYLDWVPLQVAQTEVELGVRRPDSAAILRAKKILQEAGEGPHRDLRAVYAIETMDLADYPETVKAILQAIRIGELGIVSSPCETFVETGLAIKQQSPLKPTFTIELANGYNGYLPTRDQHALGGYETWPAKSSYLAVDAEAIIRKKLMDLLQEVAQD